MSETIKVALIGLDTSHTVAFAGLIQDPATPAEQQIKGLQVTKCLRFDTPFQNTEGLDKRQAYLESIGIPVTLDFDEAVADCDAIMIEINDPSKHLEYFEKCAPLGKPIFLDKPFADNLENMKKIIELIKKYNIRFFTSSSLRYDVDFVEARAKGIEPNKVTVWGPVGTAPAGSGLIWYGCHVFEMLQAAMGRGAQSVSAYEDENGYVFQVLYADGRRGTVDMTPGAYQYGALIRNKENECALGCVTMRIPFYFMLMKEIVRFFHGEEILPLEDSVEVMAMQVAAEAALASGKAEPVFHL